MRTNARFLVASLALIGALAAIPAQALERSCYIPVGANWVDIGLIDQPYAYQDLEPELTPAQFVM